MDLEAAVLAGVLEAELAAESSTTAEPTCDDWHEEDFDPTDFEEVNLGDRDSTQQQNYPGNYPGNYHS